MKSIRSGDNDNDLRGGVFLGRALTARIGVTPIPITPFELRNGVRMDHIFGVYACLHLGDEYAGFGYTMHIDRDSATKAGHALQQLLEALPMTPSTLLTVEELEHNGRAYDATSRSATNAISLAAWDLAGHYFNRSCAQLWGGEARALECYDSGTLAFASDHELVATAKACVAQGLRRAKMIVGQQSLEDDLARVHAVLEVLGPHNLAVDALCSWTREQANEFMAQVAQPLLWVEDPVPYNDLSLLRPLQPIAAGERSTSLAEFMSLARKGVSGMLVDPGLMGGPMHQLQVSKVLTGVDVQVGFHAYPYYLAHIAACLNDPLPVEMQNWGDALFSSRPQLDGEGRLTIRGPGFGLTADMPAIESSAIMQAYVRKSPVTAGADLSGPQG